MGHAPGLICAQVRGTGDFRCGGQRTCVAEPHETTDGASHENPRASASARSAGPQPSAVWSGRSPVRVLGGEPNFVFRDVRYLIDFITTISDVSSGLSPLESDPGVDSNSLSDQHPPKRIGARRQRRTISVSTWRPLSLEFGTRVSYNPRQIPDLRAGGNNGRSR